MVMRRRGTGRRSDERGAGLVEMALVTVLLLLLLAGVVDLGRVFYEYIIVTNAAREGARYGSFYPWQYQKIRDAALQEAAGSGVTLDPAKIFITPAPSGCSEPTCAAQPGQPIWVGVEHTVDTWIGSMVGASSITLRRAAQMVVFGADLP
jgi:Flp pilus assembly protein TadG